jgi:hypothetical protein
MTESETAAYLVGSFSPFGHSRAAILLIGLRLACNREDQGRYPEAEPLFKRTLPIREPGQGANHPDLGTALNNLAGPY